MNHSQELIILNEQFNQVKQARGKAKLPLIKKFSEAQDTGRIFMKILNFVFNPHISSGIAKKKIEKKILGFPNAVANSIEDVFDYLAKNNSGSDADILYVQFFIEKQPEEVHEFLKNVFTKDLQIGASEKTINEALGYEFIPIWKVMLAHRWEHYESKVKGDFFITLKMDDYRCTCIYDEKQGKWLLKARIGLLYEGVVEIEKILEKLPKDMVLDGGLLSTDETLDSKARFRKTGQILRSKGEKTGIMFYIYDMLPKSEFLKGKSSEGYKKRQENIDTLMKTYNLDTNPLFKKVPCFYYGSDKSVIMSLLNEVLAKGHEGLMINTADGKYETKRTSAILKVKEFYTVDLRIIGYKEYKHPNMLGAFICDYKGNEVSVGGGFKEHERVDFWKKRDELIGKIIEVRYFQESENQDGKKSIRHGHFIRVRDDKTEPSYS